MTKLEPCPFCGEDVVHEFKTNEIGEPYGDGLYVCQNTECGAKFKFPQDWNLSMSRKRESERRFNTRYKRTCNLNEARALVEPDICGDGWDADARRDAIIKNMATLCGAEVTDA